MDPPLAASGVPQNWYRHIGRQLEGAEDNFAAISRLEIGMYAANKLLADGDVMSMSRGLEVRFPLLDVDLIATAMSLPARSKKSSKSIAKPALVNAIPGFPLDLMHREKRGFTLPLERWLRLELRDQCHSALNELTTSFGFDKRAIDGVLSRFEKSRGGMEWLRVWQLFSLSSWHRNYYKRLEKNKAA